MCNCNCNHNHVKQNMLNILTCIMLSNYFVIGSLSDAKHKFNHVWNYVIYIVRHVKYVNGLYY